MDDWKIRPKTFMNTNNQEISVSPYAAIRLFAKTYIHNGEEIFTSRKYKLTREAWIASMFLLGIRSNSGYDWFFKPEMAGSPDFYCYAFIYDKEKRGSIRQEVSLEVFEYRNEENEEDFLEALKKIKLNKIVDPNLTLVCYIRRSQVIPSAIELNKELKKIHPKIKEIWYLGNVSSDSRIWRITQIYPNTTAIDLDYDEILATKEKHSFIHAYRGKSDSFEYENTGKKVILTPEFEIKLFD